MRKTFLALGIFMIVNSSATPISTIAHAQPGIPAYAKWGSLAMQETQSKYPHAAIIDYLHEGREVKDDSTIEKFKLWLRDGDHEFGVLVTIEFATNTEKVIAITFQETSK
ncbi:YqzG/YhdC family protein [Sporosarcina sp. YIM B06819]|uniref:YqzG/YhdC family protein n=1 Tax=Sporosarcina sp. YIM B06819 TaxID=3081769 RepID=UPI00298C609F|nr:YqzG/YhdC family protein [Sporosarcina sp. YIM B06819]